MGLNNNTTKYIYVTSFVRDLLKYRPEKNLVNIYLAVEACE